ncbi:MAG: M36 family metallopeptidase [Bacteroidota bacterium]
MKHTLRFIFSTVLLFAIHWQLAGQSNAESAALVFLQQQSEKLGLSENDIADVIVTDNYSSRHNGVTHVYLKQRFQGIIIERAVVNVNLNGQYNLISLHNRFHNDLTGKINAVSPQLNANQALQKAISHLGFIIAQPEIIEQKADPSQYTLFAKDQVSLSDIPVYLVYEPMANGQLILVWAVDIYTTNAAHFWNMKIDAQTGELITNKDLVVHCNFQSVDHQHEHEALIGKAKQKLAFSPAHLNKNESGFFDYLVYPLPVESPNHGDREVVNDPSHPIASPWGWHDTDGIFGAEYSITRGNNVWAKEDAEGDNETTIGNSPDPGFLLEYIYPLDLQDEPEVYLDAATTNLFYWNNVIHDVWYQYGFDEESGNFQENNYGRGGIGNDFVQADCQDGSFFNNANFFTPAEPDTLDRKPRMQMALWTGPGSGSKFLTINEPASLQGIYDAVSAIFGPELPPSDMPITNDLVLVDDGSANPSSGCNPILNGNEVSGKIAFLDIGGCATTDKVIHAQDAGALAVLVCFTFGDNPVTLTGENPDITIPTIVIGNSLCQTLKSELPNVNISISKDPDGGPSLVDSDLDNGVIVHEYGHGLTNRLVGGPANRDCLGNQEQAGEGWSDWLALMMTMTPTDIGLDPRGIGTYVSLESPRGPGIRPYPYSNNHFVNPHTYRNINTEFYPHGSGSVMAAMLWDLTWGLVDNYGFDPDLYHGTAGNNMAFQLVIDGLKLIPCEPGYVDIRDGILLADSINYAGANQCLIWDIFAQRGLGFGADQGSSQSRADGTESFILPPSCIQELTLEKSVSADQALPGDTITFTINVFNGSSQTLTNNIVRDTFPPGIDYVVGSINCGANFSNGILTIPMGTLDPQEEVECTFQATIDESFFTNYLFFDDMENGESNWVISHGLGDADWELRQAVAASGEYAWFASNVNNISDQYLTLATPITLTGTDLKLRFLHNFRTEALYDGGVVEISANGGPWEDLGPHIQLNGYSGLLNPDNPLGEREAFWGSSNGYIKTIVDLQSYQGQQVLIRFRLATDGAFGNSGWRVDDVSIANEHTIPNTACVSNDEGFDTCGSIEDPTLILDPAIVSTERVEQTFEVFVYPNPGEGNFKIGLTGDVTDDFLISVFHINGQQIKSETVSSFDLRGHYTVNLSGLPAGIYVFKIANHNSTTVKKIVLQN